MRSGPAPRETGLDVVRAVALVSMYVAHFAPSDGPGGVLGLSEYLTAPLFAFLIGWSAHLALARGRESVRDVTVRGLVVLLVGLALEPAIDQIYVILPWLALLIWVMGALSRLGSRWLVVLATGLVLVEPTLLDRSRDWLQSAAPERHGAGIVSPVDLLPKLVELAAGGDAYRLTVLVPMACLGVLVARHAAGGPVGMITGATACAGSAVLLLLGQLDAVTLEPYSGRWAELVLEALLVVAVTFVVRRAAAVLPRTARLLAPAGAMTLSLYVVQVLASQAWIAAGVSDRGLGGTSVATDDSWLLLAVLVLGSVVLAAAWARLLGGTPLARGPLEAVVHRLTRASAPVRAA
ncbi:hypothetical protein [Marmoricola endophyticus]|nr:hypothetical protein [Marmoricola endophyticus]